MDYLTTAEFAEKWMISQRRVTIYCKGQIDGAVLIGRLWMIPKETKKPDVPRRVRKLGHKNK